jgi:glutathione S-transferase
MSSDDIEYTVYYWPEIPGRGEYIRLVFEAAGVPYTYVDDVREILKVIQIGESPITPTPHFAPPVMKISRPSRNSPPRKTRKTEEGQGAAEAPEEGERNVTYLSQSIAIMHYLGVKFGLVGDLDGDDEEERALRRARVTQYMLTTMDFGTESHDVHHPIATSLHYEDQKVESLRRAGHHRQERIPKFFKHFELALKANPEGQGKYLVGQSLTVADLFALQVFDGVCFGFPKLIASFKKLGLYPTLFAWRESMDEDKKIGPFLKSGRRIPFALGLYRYYDELDGEYEEKK